MSGFRLFVRVVVMGLELLRFFDIELHYVSHHLSRQRKKEVGVR